MIKFCRRSNHDIFHIWIILKIVEHFVSIYQTPKLFGIFMLLFFISCHPKTAPIFIFTLNIKLKTGIIMVLLSSRSVKNHRLQTIRLQQVAFYKQQYNSDYQHFGHTIFYHRYYSIEQLRLKVRTTIAQVADEMGIKTAVNGILAADHVHIRPSAKQII